MVSVIPQPVSLEIKQGCLILDRDTTVVCCESVASSAEHVAALIGRALGAGRLSVSDTAEGTSCVLTIDASLDLPSDEGYTLEVTGESVVLAARSKVGLLHGSNTLLQMILTAEVRGVVPCCSIRDYPRFPWRGSLLDTCRHFWTIDDTKRYIDLLALYRMNVLHWHLTEDQGWRVEIKKYPKLTGVGAWRDDGDGGKYGGSYTQDEVRDVIAYATERGITIVPEIEMPGHSLAALAAYPELSCAGGPFEVRTTWGISEHVYCAGNEKVFEFFEDVLSEVMDMFPSKHIHIGGDECPKSQWKTCPKCQKRMKEQGLSTEFELQKYFINRIERFLSDHGRILVGWDEILESYSAGVGHEVEVSYDEAGGALALSESAVVQSWRGIEGGAAAARTGHDVVMSPTTHCYLDYGVGEKQNTEIAYSFEPVPDDLEPEHAAHILGLEGNVWTEGIADRDRWDFQVFPRLCALAEVAWSPRKLRNWNAFRARLAAHEMLLKAQGVKFWRDPGVWAEETACVEESGASLTLWQLPQPSQGGLRSDGPSWAKRCE